MEASPAIVESAAPAAVTARSLCAGRWIVAGITLLISCLFLFVHLGHYGLWDDESLAALIGDGVWHTGDTSAVHGHNIVAYRDGLLIKGLKDRSSPPLQYYIVAPFVGLLGDSSFAARLPMALLGLGCVGLMLWWLKRDQADMGTCVLFAMALLGNVSFFLYFRQCRYYAPAMFLLVATAYSYVHAQTRKGIIVNAILWVLLFTANYLTWGAGIAMVGVDYLIWGRKRRKLSPVDWAIIILPQLIIGGIVLHIWNPASIDAGNARGPWLADRLTLLWWTIRDLNNNEYCVGLLILAAPFVAFFMKRIWIARALVALIAGTLAIVILSPQSTTNPPTLVSDIRYMCPMIPVCLAVEVLTLRAIAGRLWYIVAIVPALFLFYSNVFQGGVFVNEIIRMPIGVTSWRFVSELFDPPDDPYAGTADWINKNVADGDSILVLPRNPVYTCYQVYPLMFHAPKAVYAWQLNYPARDPNNANLPDINFAFLRPPDYIVVFGMGYEPLHIDNLNVIDLSGIKYQIVGLINADAFLQYRPELSWRNAWYPHSINPPLGGVKIYKRS